MEDNKGDKEFETKKSSINKQPSTTNTSLFISANDRSEEK